MVVRGDTRDDLDRHPGPSDLALVIEVADATLERDRTSKKRLYMAEIPFYWIVNLLEQQVEVFTAPSATPKPADYRDRRDYGPSDAVPLVIEGAEIAQIPVCEIHP